MRFLRAWCLPDPPVSNAAFSPILAPLPDRAWLCANTYELRPSESSLECPQDEVLYLIVSAQRAALEATSEAHRASGWQKWMECSVPLLVSWLGRVVSLSWRFRGPRFSTMAITALGIPARRVGQGCRDRPPASFPERHGFSPSMSDAFLCCPDIPLNISGGQINYFWLRTRDIHTASYTKQRCEKELTTPTATRLFAGGFGV